MSSYVFFSPVSRICKDSEEVKLPTRKFSTSAGIDLHVPEKVTIPARSRRLVPIGYKVIMPQGMFGLTADCSSVVWKKGTHIAAKICDEDYHGEIILIVVNHTDEQAVFEKGEKIAQFIVLRYENLRPALLTKESFDSMKIVTPRNREGFGVKDTNLLTEGLPDSRS